MMRLESSCLSAFAPGSAVFPLSFFAVNTDTSPVLCATQQCPSAFVSLMSRPSCLQPTPFEKLGRGCLQACWLPPLFPSATCLQRQPAAQNPFFVEPHTWDTGVSKFLSDVIFALFLLPLWVTTMSCLAWLSLPHKRPKKLKPWTLYWRILCRFRYWYLTSFPKLPSFSWTISNAEFEPCKSASREARVRAWLLISRSRSEQVFWRLSQLPYVHYRASGQRTDTAPEGQ